MQLHISPEQARRHLAAIDHVRFQQALPQYWQVDSHGHVRAQALLWLYCWARTGLNSERAAEQARQAFRSLFGHPFAWFEARIPHEYARRARYATGDIEGELALKLARTTMKGEG